MGVSLFAGGRSGSKQTGVVPSGGVGWKGESEGPRLCVIRLLPRTAGQADGDGAGRVGNPSADGDAGRRRDADNGLLAVGTGKGGE